MKEYYKLLGVSENATKEEIKNAYKQLAKKYHPDLNPNDKTAEGKFKEIAIAKDILTNDDKRAQYDAGVFDEQQSPHSSGQKLRFKGLGGEGFNGGASGDMLIEVIVNPSNQSILAEVSSGTRLRIKGKGVRKKEKPGDLFVKLRITIPKNLPNDLKAAIQNWESTQKKK